MSADPPIRIIQDLWQQFEAELGNARTESEVRTVRDKYLARKGGLVSAILKSLGIEHHAITQQEDVEFVVDRMIKQAYATQAAAAVILSPLLTSRDTRKN